ncbi:hypothetical protein Goklo_024151 [Gossypium klotzschianum]|uniref:Uncharacterized protein n=1 Tax=Gossypium klotzschianum TaxID=34286 RepID=A0A7J8WD95_9ROSI|nr:hypothetical protein [Gossypium klotzschianum]
MHAGEWVKEDLSGCTTLASLVLQPLLEGRKGLLSGILRELLSVERIRGYAKTRQHF